MLVNPDQYKVSKQEMYYDYSNKKHTYEYIFYWTERYEWNYFRSYDIFSISNFNNFKMILRILEVDYFKVF